MHHAEGLMFVHLCIPNQAPDLDKASIYYTNTIYHEACCNKDTMCNWHVGFAHLEAATSTGPRACSWSLPYSSMHILSARMHTYKCHGVKRLPMALRDHDVGRYAPEPPPHPKPPLGVRMPEYPPRNNIEEELPAHGDTLLLPLVCYRRVCILCAHWQYDFRL